ncbi:hypothetical protein [Magnetovibrio blakemorei]|uniref:Uncharacterized protein n=1 Tax=Magnetovibrio blakemorei TaxID=28181 RepID=A0A1E5Q4U5_9PROT|nr:hypothetical protein [Magnetovibrio blakemorei]OEJ64603.1 hypothetical protein BEN30_00440 [Magnetovibrio blakemorei]
MTVWGGHTKGMDHLHLRAEQHIAKARKRKSSVASHMDKLSHAEQRKALYEQRAQAKLRGRRDWDEFED